MTTHDIYDTTNPFLPAAGDVLGALRIEAPWLFDDPDAPVAPSKRTRSHAKACPARAAEEDVCVIVHGEVDEAFLSRKIEIGASADGAQTKSGRWKVWKTDIRGFLNKFLKHKVGEKDGHCFLQGPPLDGKRQASAIPHMDLLSLDLDTGESIESIIERVKALGLFALIYTTYSHMKPVTDVKRDAVIKWSGVEDPNPSLEAVKGYLLEVKRYQPWVLEDARLVETKHTAEGVKIFIEHKPMPKFRVVLVLENRFTVLDRAAKQSDAIREWKERYAGASQLLGASFDRSCVDPSRLFYLPRHPRGAAEWRIEVVAGRPLDLDRDVDRVTEAELRAAGKNEFEIAADKVAGKAGSYVTDNLMPFFAKYGDRFELETWLLEVDPEGDRGSRPNGPGRTHRCPNDDAHSNAGEESDQGFFCVNGGETDTGQCVAHCMHDACADLDRVNFVDLMCQAVGTTDAMDLKRWVPELVGEGESQDEEEAQSVARYKDAAEAKQAIAELSKADAEAAGTVVARIAASKFKPTVFASLKSAWISRTGLNATTFNNEIDLAKEEAENHPAHLDDDVLATLASMNKSHAMVLIGGKLKIMKEPDVPGRAPAMLDLEAFNAWHENKRVHIENANGDRKLVSVGKLWREWEDRREYTRIVFKPGTNTPNEYNIYKGLAVEPKAGDWSILRNHVLENVCQGNVEYFNWLMTWMAQLLRFPGDKLGSAVGICGKKGTGKSKLFDWLRKALGEHSLKVSDSGAITGGFNKHQQGLVLLVCEEAFWAGDREASGKLKDLITSDEMLLTPKGVDSIPFENFMRLVMISNEDWFIPAGLEDERRFFVLECGNARKQDIAFFQSVDDQMKSGGLQAMVAELLAWEPTMFPLGWNVLRTPPETPWLAKQGRQDLKASERFLVHVARNLIDTVSEGEGEYKQYSTPGESEGIAGIGLNVNTQTRLTAGVLMTQFIEWMRWAGEPNRARRAEEMEIARAMQNVWGAQRERPRGEGTVYVCPPVATIQENVRVWLKEPEIEEEAA